MSEARRAETSSWKVNTKGLKDDIIAKFRSDLRKLCELTTGATNRLKRTKSALPDIIAKGVKIKHIYVICSWFESHKSHQSARHVFRHVQGAQRMAETRSQRSRRRFTDEFKQQPVRLVVDEGESVGAVARELGLVPSALGQWVKQAQVDRSKGRTGLTTAEREELARLRKENRILRLSSRPRAKSACSEAVNSVVLRPPRSRGCYAQARSVSQPSHNRGSICRPHQNAT